VLEAERQVRLVGKLLKMTNAGEIRWTVVDSSMSDDWDDASDIFEASSGTMNFRLYQRGQVMRITRGKRIDLRRGSGGIVTVLDVTSDKDEGRRVIIDVGDMPLLRILFSAVRGKTTSIDADIEAFIGQEERHAERHHG
jgi:hypothetical protein